MPVYEGVLFQRIQFVYFHRILVHRHFDRLSSFSGYLVSIRRTTGFEPFYTVIATVTINLIVAVAIVLLNLYVAAEISYLIL